jgi:hypothetical protein
MSPRSYLTGGKGDPYFELHARLTIFDQYLIRV